MMKKYLFSAVGFLCLLWPVSGYAGFEFIAPSPSQPAAAIVPVAPVVEEPVISAPLAPLPAQSPVALTPPPAGMKTHIIDKVSSAKAEKEIEEAVEQKYLPVKSKDIEFQPEKTSKLPMPLTPAQAETHRILPHHTPMMAVVQPSKPVELVPPPTSKTGAMQKFLTHRNVYQPSMPRSYQRQHSNNVQLDLATITPADVRAVDPDHSYWTTESLHETAPVTKAPVVQQKVRAPSAPRLAPQMIPESMPQTISSAGQSQTVTPMNDYPVIQGFGKALPMVLAVRQIVPKEYVFSFDNGIDPGEIVDWSGGKPWPEVLSATLAAKGYNARIRGTHILIGASS